MHKDSVSCAGPPRQRKEQAEYPTRAGGITTVTLSEPAGAGERHGAQQRRTISFLRSERPATLGPNSHGARYEMPLTVPVRHEVRARGLRRNRRTSSRTMGESHLRCAGANAPGPVTIWKLCSDVLGPVTRAAMVAGEHFAVHTPATAGERIPRSAYEYMTRAGSIDGVDCRGVQSHDRRSAHTRKFNYTRSYSRGRGCGQDFASAMHARPDQAEPQRLCRRFADTPGDALYPLEPGGIRSSRNTTKTTHPPTNKNTRTQNTPSKSTYPGTPCRSQRMPQPMSGNDHDLCP